MSERLSEAASVCQKAAALIERDGWCQGVSRTEDGGRCIVTALVHAQNYCTGRIDPAVLSALDFLGIEIIRWNDAPGRTKEEVLARLRSVR